MKELWCKVICVLVPASAGDGPGSARAVLLLNPCVWYVCVKSSVYGPRFWLSFCAAGDTKLYLWDFCDGLHCLHLE